MLNTYIKINDKQIIAGQTSNGIWYCKELPADNPKQLERLIGETNQVLNKYNRCADGEDTKPKNKKKDIPPVSSPIPPSKDNKVRM